MADVAFEGSREIPLVVHGHHQALIIVQVDHAPPFQVEHLAHEPDQHIRPAVRLEWLFGEYWDVRHQVGPDRAGQML